MAIDDSQVVSRKRVADHGEVYTAKREVNAMLDLVKQETERIESRFLEPACGTGNFLTEILERKLRVVESRYRNSQAEFERYSILAISSIYGIDILLDNVQLCRERLFEIFCKKYDDLYGKEIKENCKNAAKYILEQNIIWGDALELKTVDENPKSIVFAEWAAVNGNMLKRRDFTFNELLTNAHYKSMPLFSDLGDDVFLPQPVKEYPLVHFLEVGNGV